MLLATFGDEAGSIPTALASLVPYAREHVRAIRDMIRRLSPALHTYLHQVAAGAPLTLDGILGAESYLRAHSLIKHFARAGIFEPRDVACAHFRQWLHDRVHGLCADDAAIILQYGISLLDMVRARRARHSSLCFTLDGERWYVHAAIQLLQWLRERKVSLGTMRQDDVDAYHVASRRRYLAQFLHWAIENRLCNPALERPAVVAGPAHLLADAVMREHYARLRDTDAPASLRFAGGLIVIYAQRVPDIVSIAREDITEAPGLELFAHRRGAGLPIVEPVAGALRAHLDTLPPDQTRLFASPRNPTGFLSPKYLITLLRESGLISASIGQLQRTALTRLCQLSSGVGGKALGYCNVTIAAASRRGQDPSYARYVGIRLVEDLEALKEV